MNEPESSAPQIAETANIHLQFGGHERVVPVLFQPGEQSPRDLLPIAQTLAHHVTELAIESAHRAGKTVSCRNGCAACCRQLIGISLLEAQSLADIVGSLPPERQALIRGRFAEAIRRMEKAGLLDANENKGNRRLLSPDVADQNLAIRAVAARYFAQQIACPFLENESCSIYSQRPLVCREYHVTSPAEDCTRLYEIGVDRVEIPIPMVEVMVRVARRVAGTSQEAIPLVLALEWAEAHSEAFEKKVDSFQMLRTIMVEIDQEYANAFENRENTEGHA
jgi:Fe-S-cluster containining protein